MVRAVLLFLLAFLLLYVLIVAAMLTVWIVESPASADVAASNPAGVISQTNWRLMFVDSQELVEENGAATNAFDGNTATIWHTLHQPPPAPPPPHEIQIDLGADYTISGFRYLPRQDGNQNGWIGQYAFYVSSGGDWGTPVATGTFAKDMTEKEVIFAAQSGRYVRLRALKEINGNPWTTVAEINVLGTPMAPQTITVSWQDTNTAEKGFSVESGPTATGPFSLVGQVGPNIKQFSEPEHYDSPQVCYRVRAYNASQQGPYSSVNCVTIPPLPGLQASDEQLVVQCNLVVPPTQGIRAPLLTKKKAIARRPGRKSINPQPTH